ncbi:response regulator transcription factor [Vibrio natriegens]|jgi:RNA polymerase sigma factor (sigma-70 family)|uniref:response regulator transcription factor n=1 Tax=Vibrio TaxID=662 RepID=UPI000E552F8D|nr:response regulator [Vibrio sp. dhg]AXT73202.1 DNA-binding response regulator [Vibrio sp. dhg]
MQSEQIVYVVDDDQGMLDSTVWLFESVGLKAVPFSSGQDFLSSCDPEANACVLLDIRMPGMGGLHIQEEMRRRGIKLPVIFVSGHADVPIVVRAFKSGAVDFIEKPYNDQLLLDSVQDSLQSEPSVIRSNAQQLIEEKLNSLTPREQDVFLPLIQGYTSREIAEQLEISIKTVDLYRSRIMKRLEANNLPELVGMAIVAGVVDPLDLRANKK